MDPLEIQQTYIRNVRLIDPHAQIDRICNILVGPDGITVDGASPSEGTPTVDGHNLWAMPGLVDLQVHFRQPGFEYKETIESGSRAALAGGITSVVVMPNTHPSLDSPEQVRYEIEETRRVNGIDLMVAAAATRGLKGEEMTDIGALAKAGAVAITDDGLPVMDDAMMEACLWACAEHDLLFMQHAEDLRLTKHAPMTLGPTSEKLGVRGQPADAEGIMVERDVKLAEKTGARYHVLHTSTVRSLAAIRWAKKRDLPVSCEASPHHLLLTDEACAGGDPLKKMNPPLRSESDRQALITALLDGTVDAVATDHAPHADHEKARGFVDAPFGVTGLETALSALLTFYHRGELTAQRVVELMTTGPARVLKQSGTLGTTKMLDGAESDTWANLCLVSPDVEWTVSVDDLKGMSKNSAFLDMQFRGKVCGTFLRGELRHDDGLVWL